MSTTFTDTHDRNWSLALNVAAIKRVRDQCGVDLMTAVQGPLLERLGSDPVLLVDVLCAVCRPQLEHQGVTDEAFGESLDGDSIEAATAALLEGLIAFFPRAKRNVLSKLMSKLRAAETAAIEMAEAEVEKLDLDQMVRTVMTKETEPERSGG